ncbi:DNA-binding protein [Mesorhizobium sp. B2-4-19]|nr:DNA-binding protein [Mesorhizobium sp. B2-4-19]
MVADRYHISPMTIWRWLKSDLGFPRPLYIGRNRYWQENDLVEWEASRRAGAMRPQRSRQQ